MHQNPIAADMHGRTVLVTGGTAGIGYEVARAFAASRARVLLLSRKVENGDRAMAEIKKAVSDQADVHFVECDLGNIKNVKETGDRIREEEKRLDIIVADAGIGVNKFDVSSDGFDRHFAVNHLGHFLLINRLLPLMRKTSKLANAPPPRIVSVSSELHRMAPSSIQFASKEEVMEAGSRNLSAVSLYARSKLANILFTKYTLVENALQPSGDRILAVATHPGVVHTGQQDQFKEAYGSLVGSLVKAVTVPFMRNPEQGSVSTLWASTADDAEKNGWQGYYFTDPGQVGKESAQACDAQLGKNLHELSEALIVDKLGKDALFPWKDAST
ncbi:hypothetical protein V8E55_004795 [Tylopilus felleus]